MILPNLKDFSLVESDILQKDENTFIVRKWNWDYQQALAFQEYCQEQVSNDKNLKFLIFCSHPHCFTMGRGLQKSKGKIIDGLVESSDSALASLPFPLHKILRGGGLTFHYPGQWIFYPVINLNHPEHNLSDLVNRMLEDSQKLLKKNFHFEISSKMGELMGLWSGQKKFASLGIELKRFVTMHGMALNFYHDKSMFEALIPFSPCGLSSSLYESVESISSTRLNDNQLDKFTNEFLEFFFL